MDLPCLIQTNNELIELAGRSYVRWYWSGSAINVTAVFHHCFCLALALAVLQAPVSN